MEEQDPQEPKEEVSRRGVTRRRARPNRLLRWSLAILAVCALAGAVGLVLSLFVLPGRWGPSGTPAPGMSASAAQTVTLYFGHPRWTGLVPETRELRPQGDDAQRIRALVEALAEGPRGAGAAVLPAGTRLRGVYVGRDGLAVVDFEPASGDLSALGGASGELLTVFSLVHTIAQNVPGIQSVQILVGGEVRETLAGHVKISEALRPDPQWITGGNGQ